MISPDQPAQPVQPDDSDVLGRRIAATLVDIVILTVVFIAFSVLFGQSTAGDGSASVNLSGAPFLAYLLVAFLYYFGLETARGQTFGKSLLGVRVVMEDGSKPGAGAIALRTALRAVDGLFFYLVAFVVVMATGRRRARVGDLVGGTRVVRA